MPQRFLYVQAGSKPSTDVVGEQRRYSSRRADISQRNTRATTRAVLQCNKHTISLRTTLAHLLANRSTTSLHPVVARHLIGTFIVQLNAGPAPGK